MSNLKQDEREKLIDDLQNAVHPDQAEHTPVLLWGTLADHILANYTLKTEATLPSIHMNDVNGIDCPACGHPTLMLMSGNYITCCMADCPNPDYSEALAAAQERAVAEAETIGRAKELEVGDILPDFAFEQGCEWYIQGVQVPKYLARRISDAAKKRRDDLLATLAPQNRGER